MYPTKIKFIILLVILTGVTLNAQNKDIIDAISSQIEMNMGHYQSLYRHLHQHPELSYQEFATSDRMAEELKDLNFDVTKDFGGNSLVGVFNNGDGPVVLIRTDMDALPIEEKTGLSYASQVKAKTDNGDEVSVMHACGHDIHMTVWVGTANALVQLRDQWKGTLIMIAQQAEEKSGGANVMIQEGLFQKFPVPDYALALHVSPELPSNAVGYVNGATAAGVNSVDIKVHGEGGHGAYPHKTIDPVVLASRIILDLQTVVSREIPPLDPAVVTVGSIHGGTQHNIIPDQVDMQLTIRFYEDRVYDQIIDAINRISKGVALSAGLPEEKYPEIRVYDSFTPPVLNDPVLTAKAVSSFQKILGKENVIEVEPTMAGEDFGRYGRTPENVPIFLFWLGTIDPEEYALGLEQGVVFPPLHSPHFAPDYQHTIFTGIKAMSFAVFDLLSR